MSRIPEVSNGNRHSGNMAIEGRILEGHTSAYTAASASATRTLTITSSRYQKLTETAAFDLVLPAESLSAGLDFVITNSGVGTHDIAVKDDAGNTIAALSNSEQVTVVCNGTAWIGMGIITVAL
jgi:hypothetical protein